MFLSLISHTPHTHLILLQQVATVKQDRLARKLLQNGNRFGRQHVIFQARHAYPAYVVKYTLVPDDAVSKLPVVKVQSSPRCISVTVAGESVYRANPHALKHSLLLVKINFVSLNHGKATIFDIHEVQSVTESMTDYLSSLTLDEIVVVAVARLPLRSEVSPVMVDVLRSLRSIGGSLYALEGPYVLVGAKQPHLLNGLVHEDQQPIKAAVEVDLRVIRYNRDRPIAPIAQNNSETDDDMTPVRWQQEDKSNKHGVTWKDLLEVGPHLTAAYQRKEVCVVINGYTVNLVKMKVRGGSKIRCLNSKGQILSALSKQSNEKKYISV